MTTYWGAKPEMAKLTRKGNSQCILVNLKLANLKIAKIMVPKF